MLRLLVFLFVGVFLFVFLVCQLGAGTVLKVIAIVRVIVGVRGTEHAYAVRLRPRVQMRKRMRVSGRVTLAMNVTARSPWVAPPPRQWVRRSGPCASEVRVRFRFRFRFGFGFRLG